MLDFKYFAPNEIMILQKIILLSPEGSLVFLA